MGISHLFVVIVDLFFAESRCISGDEVIDSVQFSRSTMSDSLRPHELQHARPPWEGGFSIQHNSGQGRTKLKLRLIDKSISMLSQGARTFPEWSSVGELSQKHKSSA